MILRRIHQIDGLPVSSREFNTWEESIQDILDVISKKEGYVYTYPSAIEIENILSLI